MKGGSGQDDEGVADWTKEQVDGILCATERAALGERGENVESCPPLQLPSDLMMIDEGFMKRVITRCLCGSYRGAHVFSSHVMGSSVVTKVLRKVTQVLSQEENVVDMIVPDNGALHVVGDTHGDLHSLIGVLCGTGLPSDMNRVVFDGDFVDRGPWGIEIIVILSLLKIWQPKNVVLLRGNHETTGCISRYGFEDEVKFKLSSKMMNTFVNMFRQLPLVAVLRTIIHEGAITDDSTGNDDVKKKQGKNKKQQRKNNFTTRASHRKQQQSGNSSAQYSWNGPLTPGEKRCVVLHGGLFRSESARKENRNDLATLAELMDLNRAVGDPYGNAVEDVLWSDPQLAHNGISENPFRGCGILYGRTTVEFFFQHNSVHSLIRAHEGPDMRSDRRPDMPDMQKGYSVDMELGSTGFVATIFSAANYSFQDPKGNYGAFATMFGKRHEEILEESKSNNMTIPRFTMFNRFEPPHEDDVHLFYTSDGPVCTPRQSFS